MLSSKMLNISEKTDLELSLMTFPQSGMCANGIVLPQIPLDFPIKGNDCSLFPTPVASDNMNILGNPGPNMQHRSLVKGKLSEFFMAEWSMVQEHWVIEVSSLIRGMNR